ncbi:hypothetical protein BCR34DRAFT_667812 [Clohesyomyces aquaticus]|uniref:RING-type domain-containing protein n=1 Tax=Clohesyomyces aquaticus TaxID=1231657 RepID=A0A1Y1YV22_9PLEO|nr:hypothetical protein BCR34DRAFT_667812 [Clohesyomyces aquaticus]
MDDIHPAPKDNTTDNASDAQHNSVDNHYHTILAGTTDSNPFQLDARSKARSDVMRDIRMRRNLRPDNENTLRRMGIRLPRRKSRQLLKGKLERSRRRKYIDLTIDIEHCSSCSLPLETGNDLERCIYVMQNCRCVYCGGCVDAQRWCRKLDHHRYGIQEQLKLYGLACNICQHDYVSDRISTACGHVFCRNCLSTWFNIEQTCPMCKEVIIGNPKDLSKFPIIQPGQMGVERYF